LRVKLPDGLLQLANIVEGDADRGELWLFSSHSLDREWRPHPQNPIVRTLLAPGLWLQSLTTREPTLDQVEVSIQALRDVLDAEAAAATPSAVEVSSYPVATQRVAVTTHVDLDCSKWKTKGSGFVYGDGSAPRFVV
jgi:hypothetical protein